MSHPIIVPDCLGIKEVYDSFKAGLVGVDDCNVFYHAPGSKEDLIGRIKNAVAIIHFFQGVHLSKDVIESAKDLKLISIAGPTAECIDLRTTKDRNIEVKVTKGTSVDAVAEFTIGLMISLARRIPQVDQEVKNGQWRASYGMTLCGNTLGIIGLGAIGKRVAQIALSMGLRVIAWSPNLTAERAASYGVTHVSLENLLSNSDIVSVHLRASADSRPIISADHFAAMKCGAFFINTARGNIVDEEALWRALDTGHLKGAGLDVFEREPLVQDCRWKNFSNVILSCHNAWRTRASLDKMVMGSVMHVNEFFKQ